VLRVKADKPADGLIAFAQRERVTHVIFGQSARTRWERLVRGSTLDKFSSAVPDATVQLIPLTETRLSLRDPSGLREREDAPPWAPLCVCTAERLVPASEERNCDRTVIREAQNLEEHRGLRTHIG
jgi:K+-sensing histidine kinase KdpD